MADSSRVEELRKRYHENPRRFFAPLANEYRKGGFLDRAILLCQKHLGEQPGNMNGLIVYGQTLFESGRHEEARAPFESALELDPENLIALRHLGDIARLAGDNAAAQQWYGRVLEYDRRNDEVRELLDQVGGPAAAARSSTALGSPANAAAAEAATLELIPTDLAIQEPLSAPSLAAAKTLEITPRRRPSQAAPSAAAPAPVAPPAPPAPAAPRLPTPPRATTPAKGMRRASLLDINFDFGEIAETAASTTAPVPSAPLLGSEAAEYGFAAATHDLPLLDPIEEAPSEPHLSTEMDRALIDLPPEPESLGEVASIPGLEAAEYEADVAPLDDLEPAEFDGGGESIAPLMDLEEVEFQVPAADEPFGALSGFEPEDEFRVPMATPPTGELTFIDDAIESASAEPAILTPDSMPIVDSESFPGRVPTPASQSAIVTETMAELYLEQGHRAAAMEVYRQLITQDPSDAALRARLASLESEPARDSMEFDVPADAAEDAGDRAPANAMLAEVSFADLDLSTPAAAPDRATPAGPSARDFFAAFAKRTLARGSAAPRQAITPPSGSWAVPAAISSLDDLFGIEVTDEDQRAANYLSGVGTTSAPSGTSSFDALFASKDSAPAPRHSMPRASEKLKFDQFFSASSSARTATPVPEPTSAPEPDTSAPAAGEDDDLDQFQGWLKGLTQ